MDPLLSHSLLYMAMSMLAAFVLLRTRKSAILAGAPPLSLFQRWKSRPQPPFPFWKRWKYRPRHPLSRIQRWKYRPHKKP